jgi:class 3 adenylate cyclase/tetratricopeptide (TPR) repeat protein
MRCPSCMAENAAIRRFCAQCGVALPSACPACGFENEPTARFCGGCGKPVGEVAVPASVTVPAPHRNDGAERRQLTVMFCDLVSSTALASRLDPEDLRDVIAAYHRTVAETIGQFDGYVAKYMGDGVLVYFGYPQAEEDSAERAIRAGLALIDSISQLDLANSKLQLRVGIATGLVVVGDLVGIGEAQERSVVGETPNLAARLQAFAQPNAVLIAESTRRLVGALFEYRSLGVVDVKGLSGPVTVWQVLRPGVIPSRFEALHAASLTPLVGREDEIELLLRRWARARQGEGQIVLLSGEAGIGKSRITAALHERLHDEPLTRLRCFCSPHHRDSPLHPFIARLERAAQFAREDSPEVKLDKLEALLAQSEDNPTEAAALFADLLAVPDTGRYPALPADPQRRRELTFMALVRQLKGLARKKPVLMIFEDVHWIDSTSLEVLEMFVERIPCLPVLILLTFRPEIELPWAGQPHVTTMTLSRLGQRETERLAERVAADKALPIEILDQIVKRADGIPLFIEELTKTLLEGSLLREQDGRYLLDGPLPPLAIPSSLHASLLARLDRLAPVKEVAQIGATIGREFSYEVLAAVARRPSDQVSDALARLADAGLVFRRGIPPRASFIFKHALVQDAAYSTLLRSQRQELHARIGKVLEKQFPEIVAAQPEILAHHYTQAGLVSLAIEYWRKAGERAYRRSAIVEATKHLTQGIELIPLLPAGPERNRRELGLSLALGRATWAVKGHGADTLRVYSRARDLVDESTTVEERLAVLNGLWNVEVHRARLGPTRELAGEALKLAARHQDLQIGGSANSRMGITLCLMGAFGEARSHLQRALDCYAASQENLALTAASRSGNALLLLGLTLWALGYPEQAVAAPAKALTDARDSGHAVAIGIALFWNAFLEAAFGASPPFGLSHADEAAAHCSERLKMYEPWARFNQGILFSSRGDPNSGIKIMTATMETAKEFDAQLLRPLHLGHLAVAHASIGEPNTGLCLLDEALSTVANTQERMFEAELFRMQGELLIDLGKTSEAEASLEQALAVARGQRAHMWELRAAKALARLWREHCKRDAARDLLAPIYGCFTEGFGTPDLKEARALLDEL